VQRDDQWHRLCGLVGGWHVEVVAPLDALEGERIAALGGSARQGEGASATTVALPAGQKIAVGAAGLTLAKLITARGLLGRNEAYDPDDPNDELTFVCTQEQLENLLTIPQLTSADYNPVRALVNGTIESFMGFKFIQTQLLSKVGNDRFCYAFVKSGVTLGVGADVKTNLAPRPDKRFIPYAYASMSLGAVRGEDVKVVEVSCLEA
jgi:hypothetical protein